MNTINPGLLKDIQKLGLNLKEALVYTSLLELGGAYPSKIASETGLNRSTIYDILLSLSVKGLVNGIEKRNKQFYQVEPPSHLVRFIKNKVAIAEDSLEHLSHTLPIIEGLYRGNNNKPKVTYFDGIEGTLAVYEDHVQQKAYEMRAWGNTAALENFLPEKFFLHYRKEKERRGITTRGIVPDTEKDLGFITRAYSGFKKEIIPVMRYIPQSEFPFKAEITIYGEDKVSIINFSENIYTGVIIKDKTIYGLMSMIFELSWKSAQVSKN